MTDTTIFDRFRRRVDAFFLAIFLLSAGPLLFAPTPDVAVSRGVGGALATLELLAFLSGSIGLCILLMVTIPFRGLPEDRLRRLRVACAVAFPVIAASALVPAIFAVMGINAKSILDSAPSRDVAQSIFVAMAWGAAQGHAASFAAAAPGIVGGGRASGTKAEIAAYRASMLARLPKGLLAWSILCLLVRHRMYEFAPVANEAPHSDFPRLMGTASWILLPIAALCAAAGWFGRAPNPIVLLTFAAAATFGIYCGGVAGASLAFAWPPDLMQSPFVPLGLHLAIALITGPRFADRIVAPPAELNPA